MAIQTLLQEVLDLQPLWSHLKTPDMDRRGVIVRREMRSELDELLPELAPALGHFAEDISIEGRDGTGPKTEIPWVRIYSESRSPHATTGWYVVYLFNALGETCYLTLGHGSTEWTGSEFHPRSPEVLGELMAWARRRLKSGQSLRSDLHEAINLDARRTRLGPAYEAGTAFAFRYDSGSIPTDNVLIEDLRYMLALLAAVYHYEETEDAIPGSTPPEVLDVVEESSKAAGRTYRRPRGQGRRQSATERKVIEMHAVDVVTRYLLAQGFAVDYVGDSESYDIRAIGSDEVIHVEVKGTTSLGEEVVLTANEVAFHRETFPDNALFVVHSIRLDREGEAPTASGGSLIKHQPWELHEYALTPVSFRYSVPTTREIDD